MITCEEHSSGSAAQVMRVVASRLAERHFTPPLPLRNGHAMTIFGNLWPRRFEIFKFPSETREFATEPKVRLIAHCHWQASKQTSPSVIIIHGLEGSAQAHYVLGTAEKAFRAGFN